MPPARQRLANTAAPWPENPEEFLLTRQRRTGQRPGAVERPAEARSPRVGQALAAVRRGLEGTAGGGFAEGIASAVCLRHDHGLPLLSGGFQRAIRLPCLESFPAAVREPEAGGCMECFFRSLGELILPVLGFDAREASAEALEEFRRRSHASSWREGATWNASGRVAPARLAFGAVCGTMIQKTVREIGASQVVFLPAAEGVAWKSGEHATGRSESILWNQIRTL